MAFRCGHCNVAQAPGTRAFTKVIAKRDRTYTTPGGEIPGWEIVHEVKLCRTCAGLVPAPTEIEIVLAPPFGVEVE